MNSPVIGAGRGGSHSSVNLIWNQPEEAPLCNQANVLPVLLSKVAAVSVEVPQKHHILLLYKHSQQN